MNDWETKLEEIFGKKAPQLPANAKEAIVKYGPYITLVLLVLSLPVILIGLGLGAIVAPFAALEGHTGLSLSLLASLISLVLEIMALPLLFKRSLKGWRYMLYASIISAVGSLLDGNIIGMLVSAAISFYFLFQIKPLYK